MSQSCVYMHVFPNGKRYIGVAKGNPKKRWGADGNKYSRQPSVWGAIQKYGWDNVEHLIVAKGLTHEEALKLEARLISVYHTFPPSLGFGYNATAGGEERTPTEESRKKISARSKKMWEDEDFRNRMCEIKKVVSRNVDTAQYLKKYAQEHGHPLLGKHLSEARREHLSEVLKGKKPWNTGKRLSPEHCAKLSAIRKGRKQSPELAEKRAAKCRKCVVCVETGIVYNSQRIAANMLGISETHLSQCVNGQRNTAGGFHWERLM